MVKKLTWEGEQVEKERIEGRCVALNKTMGKQC